MNQKMTLDEFLSHQSKEEFLCTIELEPNEQGKVKLTPWIDEKQGCNCDSAITLNRDLIENISLTEHVHFCCGEKHKVVEVSFKENASISIKELFEMILKKKNHQG